MLSSSLIKSTLARQLGSSPKVSDPGSQNLSPGFDALGDDPNCGIVTEDVGSREPERPPGFDALGDDPNCTNCTLEPGKHMQALILQYLDSLPPHTHLPQTS